MDSEDGYEEHEKYILYVRRFNQKCNTLIDLAIANHNYNLVNKVFPLYKSVPNELDQGLSVSDGKREKQRISYSDEDKEKAKKKINVAVKNGIFPNITTEIKPESNIDEEKEKLKIRKEEIKANNEEIREISLKEIRKGIKGTARKSPKRKRRKRKNTRK